jgi:hypothetical protein
MTAEELTEEMMRHQKECCSSPKCKEFARLQDWLNMRADVALFKSQRDNLQGLLSALEVRLEKSHRETSTWMDRALAAETKLKRLAMGMMVLKEMLRG